MTTNGADLEKQPLPTHDGGVDVLSAELEFGELQRELTRQSVRSHAQANKEGGVVDVVSGKNSETSTEEEDFDLEEYLRGQEDDGVGWRKKKRIGKFCNPSFFAISMTLRMGMSSWYGRLQLC